MPFTVTLTKSVDAWLSGSQSQEVNTLWDVYVCVCACLCFLPTITRLARGLAITFPHLPSVTRQKTQHSPDVEMVAGAKRDHQQGPECWDLDQIVGLRIRPGVCNRIWNTLGYFFCILYFFLDKGCKTRSEIQRSIFFQMAVEPFFFFWWHFGCCQSSKGWGCYFWGKAAESEL